MLMNGLAERKTQNLCRKYSEGRKNAMQSGAKGQGGRAGHRKERKAPSECFISFSKWQPVVRMILITDSAVCVSGSELLQMSQSN